MIKIKDKKDKNKIDKNFFNQMNYEIAAEHGIVDNEEMKNNKKLKDWSKENKKKEK
ncbi:hypothetical protein [Clostridium sp. Cult3]|uniref:hypothetical protein n=1 Tax=Clostridium sp. Cult3 TaxID=2079004 RepID=UPI001F33FBF9|nr:hypothetical protein [Clostridium sp. Cult3]